MITRSPWLDCGRAECDNGACGWVYDGGPSARGSVRRSLIHARRHTKATGHDTVAIVEKLSRFTAEANHEHP